VIYPGADQDQPDSYCCVPTASSMAIDCSTAGVKRPGVEALRKATGIPHPYGISYTWMAGATIEVSNIKADARYGLSRAQVVDLAVSGRPFCISIDCRVTRYTARRTGTFTGGHTVFSPARSYSVQPGGEVCACEKRLVTKHSEFKIQDPGTYSVGFQQWSASLLFAAAESRTGGNGINVLVFPDTCDVYRKVTEAHWIRERPTTDSKALRRVDLGARPRHVTEIVKGEAFSVNGHTSTAWYRLAAGGYTRGDHLGTQNVSAP
jgi:hypothetical protein